MKKPAPQITSLSWGRVEVDNTSVYKDVKLFPGGSRAWDWRETGTQHHPGIQIADVEELLEHSVETIVFGCGVYGRLKVKQETLDFLKAKGIHVKIMKTKPAVEYYNQQRLKAVVGALIHTTC
ncbi:MAG: Mth938-like domain-containing protein [Fidelibacterota bacterium]